jgi:hypothetical protein
MTVPLVSSTGTLMFGEVSNPGLKAKGYRHLARWRDCRHFLRDPRNPLQAPLRIVV